MEILRFLTLDVGPYFGVFMVLVTVIYYQLRLISHMIDLDRRVNIIEENGDSTTEEEPPRKA
jgi:hypothetical protein